MVSRLTRSAVIPCSTQTSAARASVQVERALPNWREFWCKSAFSRALRSVSKTLAAACGRRDGMATTASPRVSNARRTLRTACGLHPTACAMTGVVSPRAEAKRMWQRRTVNPSDERRPACKAWRSGPLNSRTNKGFIPQRMPHALQTNNVRRNCTRSLVLGPFVGEQVEPGAHHDCSPNQRPAIRNLTEQKPTEKRRPQQLGIEERGHDGGRRALVSENEKTVAQSTEASHTNHGQPHWG